MPVLMSFWPIRHSPRVLAYRNKWNFHLEMNTRTDRWHLNAQARQFLRYCNGRGLLDRGWRFPCDSHGNARLFREQEIFFYHRLRHTGYLRHLLVRKAVKTGEILVDLITTTQD